MPTYWYPMATSWKIERALALLSLLPAMVGCGCPADSEVCGTCSVDMGQWTEHTVTSEKTGKTHSYLHHDSEKEDAPVMVMVPGLLFDARFFVNMSGLSEEFELLALHYPDSPDTFTGSQLDLAHVLDDFVQTMDLRDFVLLGNSLGGFVSMQYFRVADEDRVRALVLVSTQVFDPDEKARKKRQRTGKFLKKRSDRFILCTVKKMVQRAKGDHEAPDEQHDVFNIFETKNVAFYRYAIGILADYDGHSGAEHIHVPVLVLHGSDDELAEAENTEHTQDLLPQARMVIIDGAAHEGPFSRGEEFADAVLQWWKNGPGS